MCFQLVLEDVLVTDYVSSFMEDNHEHLRLWFDGEFSNPVCFGVQILPLLALKTGSCPTDYILCY